jgi:LmbE family N-acetylglucosaminyl deacetylase
MTNTILAISSHPDDETFGSGATLTKHAKAGINTETLCLTCNPTNRKPEFEKATTILGAKPTLWMDKTVEQNPALIKRIADLINVKRPRVVITHVPFDYHREHKTCYSLVKEAIEWAAHTTMYEDAWKVERLLLMEVNTLIPSPSVLVDISSVFDVKMKAIEQYTTQLAKFPWGYYQRVNQKKAELRGAQCNVEYAEAFIEEALPRDGPFYSTKSTDLLV